MSLKFSKTAFSSTITQHFTIDEIAERADLSVSCIKEITSGKCNPTLATLIKVADAINVRLDLLVAQSMRDGIDRALVLQYIADAREFERKWGAIELGENKGDLFDNLERDNKSEKGITSRQFGFLSSIIQRLPAMEKAKIIAKNKFLHSAQKSTGAGS